MLRYQHSGGFSVDASVRIGAQDRAGLERLLCYCAHEPFAGQRVRLEVYCGPHSAAQLTQLISTGIEITEFWHPMHQAEGR